MSRVFVAHETALGRKVVIKVLLPELAAGVSVDRFRREIQLAAQLQHPHIVPLLSAGEFEGLPYFIMPFVSGESLRARMMRSGELPIPESVRILRDVVSALAYAHSFGIVHRDIKPDNVLLSGGVAVVTDFGVAKAVTASSGSSTPALTSLGLALGTPAYMSPEQASGDAHVDHRADIYALGAMAYEMLAGRALFPGRPTPGRARGACHRDARSGRSSPPRRISAARLARDVVSGEAACRSPAIGNRGAARPRCDRDPGERHGTNDRRRRAGDCPR